MLKLIKNTFYVTLFIMLVFVGYKHISTTRSTTFIDINVEALTNGEEQKAIIGYKQIPVDINGTIKDCCVKSVISDKCNLTITRCVIKED